MNTAIQLLALLMPKPNWELLGGAATILALSFAFCFLGLIAPQLRTESEEEQPTEAPPDWEALQETNGVRMMRRGV